MDKIDDGGPAFPRPYQGDDGNITVRDWMAGQALVGIGALDDGEGAFVAATWAESAYRLADAMLIERAKGRVAG
jgi:hypothetical protein